MWVRLAVGLCAAMFALALLAVGVGKATPSYTLVYQTNEMRPGSPVQPLILYDLGQQRGISMLETELSTVSLSHDGRFVAASKYEGGDTFTITLMRLNGSFVRAIVGCACLLFEWSPDGEHYAVSDSYLEGNNAYIGIHRRDGSEIIRFEFECEFTQCVPEALAWSPTDDFVAVVVSGVDKIFLVDLVQERLIEIGRIYFSLGRLEPAWSADGRHLAYTDFDDLVVYSVEDGETVTFPDVVSWEAAYMHVTGDDINVRFSDIEANQMISVNVETGRIERGESGQIGLPSRDGRLLAFLEDGSPHRLRLTDTATGTVSYPDIAGVWRIIDWLPATP